MAVVGTVILAVAVVVTVKLSSPVKESYFNPDTGPLRQVPGDLAVVQPTKFPTAAAKVCEIRDGNGETVTRAVGQNVRLQDVIAEAWDCNPARVALPPGATTGRYDFLVTKAPDARKQLQTAVLKDLGYSAHKETRDTEVWVLRVENSALPGLSVSPDSEPAGGSVHGGNLYLKHQRLSVILDGLSRGLNRPVIDKTGLDKFYNFSVPWNPLIQQKMQNGVFSVDGVKKVLASLGIALEPGTESQNMYVVERAP